MKRTDMSLRRKIFYGFTLTIVTILLLLPATGCMARLQLLPWLSAPPFGMFWLQFEGADDSRFYAAKMKQVTKRNPSDWERQAVYVIHEQYYPEAEQSLERLNRQYPNHPLLISYLLRSMMDMQGNNSSLIHIHRPEDQHSLYGGKRYTPSPYNSHAPTVPTRVARFVALAKEGECLEPQNAFFPTMVAVGYLAGYQDGEAEKAWLRASKKPVWNDYAGEELVALWRLKGAVISRGNSFLSHYNAYHDIDRHDLVAVRTVQQWMIVRAIQAEQAGDKERGVRLRQATQQTGNVIQLQAKRLQIAMMGKAGVNISAVRPGASAARERINEFTPATDSDVTASRRLYIDYLQTNSYFTEANAFQEASQNGELLPPLVDAFTGRMYSGSEKMPAYATMWGIDLLLLVGAAFALTFGAIFKLVYRFSPGLQRSEPLSGTSRWGVSLGLFLPTLAMTASCTSSSYDPIKTEIIWGCTILGAVLLLGSAALLRFPLRKIGHGLLVMLATIAALAGLIGAALLMQATIGNTLDQLGQLSYIGVSGSEATQFVASAVVTIPLLMLAVFGVISRIIRVPVAAGVTRGMRATAVPIAAVLLLFWAGTVLYTLSIDHAANTELEMIAHRGEAKATAAILNLDHHGK